MDRNKTKTLFEKWTSLWLSWLTTRLFCSSWLSGSLWGPLSWCSGRTGRGHAADPDPGRSLFHWVDILQIYISFLGCLLLTQCWVKHLSNHKQNGIKLRLWHSLKVYCVYIRFVTSNFCRMSRAVSGTPDPCPTSALAEQRESWRISCPSSLQWVGTLFSAGSDSWLIKTCMALTAPRWAAASLSIALDWEDIHRNI